MVAEAVNASDEYAVIFAGSGTTGAIDRLIGIMNLRIPAELDAKYGFDRQIPQQERPVVFIGPFEHHSNELPWRESICDVVRIPEDRDGQIDQSALAAELDRFRTRELKDRIVLRGEQCHRDSQRHDGNHETASSPWRIGVLGLRRCRAYVNIDMQPAGDPDATKDAIFLSPHKFIGGLGTPGVLVVRRALLSNRVPDVVGGGTVSYVNADDHKYVDDPVRREEAGTPAIVEAIRAGLVRCS